MRSPQPSMRIRVGATALAAVVSVAVAMAVLSGALGLVAVGGPRFVLAASTTYALASSLILSFVGHHASRAHRFGEANCLTTVRAGVACLLAGLIPVARPDDPSLFAISFVALAAVALDGVDGWLARRSGLDTAFGARFDMETDAFLILVLCGLLAAWGIATPAVLLIGAMRYLFVAAGAVMPWLRAPLPASKARKVICAVQGVTLALAIAPVWPSSMVDLAVAAALASLLWSFGRDVRYLWSAGSA